MSGPFTILLVDDTPLFRDLGALFLARTGDVVTACDGAEALALVARQRPTVVVADLDMPLIDGAELCRRLKGDSTTRTIPVVLLTSGEDAELHARAVRAGADDIVAKPINRVALIQTVSRFLRGPGVRGLTRVPMVAEVGILGVAEPTHGIARNLSRGGIFVEAEVTAEPLTELVLQFVLPGLRQPITPTARIVWCRDRTREHSAGMGMRFLALDRTSAQQIDDYVYLRAGRIEEPSRGLWPAP